MRVKAIYRKNLKMSEGKVAAQIAHAIIGLGINDPLCTIVVLKVSDAKFKELVDKNGGYVHVDYGFTEVAEGEQTAAAWLEV
jgi:hypothetical protein